MGSSVALAKLKEMRRQGACRRLGRHLDGDLRRISCVQGVHVDVQPRCDPGRGKLYPRRAAFVQPGGEVGASTRATLCTNIHVRDLLAGAGKPCSGPTIICASTTTHASNNPTRTYRTRAPSTTGSALRSRRTTRAYPSRRCCCGAGQHAADMIADFVGKWVHTVKYKVSRIYVLNLRAQVPVS